MNKVLKAIFTLVARPGIGMPHDGKTPELLLCGAKPAGWLEWNEMDRQPLLEEAVKKGTLLKTDVYTTLNYHHYQRCSTHADVDEINEMACNKSPIFGLPLSSAEKRRMKNNSWDEDALIEGVTSGRIDTVIIFSNQVKHGAVNKLVALLDDLTERGTFNFAYHRIKLEHPLTVYGQIDQKAAINMLVDDCLKNSENVDHIADPKLLGRLLGYSDNDIAYRFEHSHAGFVTRKTEGLRRYVRQYLMLQAGPNWTRNP